ncbi:MAG TPA: peptidylprolyl isomerase [Spirochaetota bacterium]|nr:peptidylprolyl isomerase [Spirochaetota bacterium]HNT11572.1 peptidylprolyl isomerase [Spirochaetota bacterium]HPI24064.1 peptidylprolyl isomerase [Spirochaetota bacterium]HPU90440.1 peptidylprolyl isomerase [Spirochaetota bacterium]
MIEEGKYAVIHYTGTFTNGEVFDSSVDGDPFEFLVGSGQVIPGFDAAVRDMKIDEEKDVFISADDGYGQYDESLVYHFPIDQVQGQFTPEVGMTIGLQLEDGRQMPATITEIGADAITVDMNHPLAGKDLNFRIKLLEVNDEAKYGYGECGCGCGDDSCSTC